MTEPFKLILACLLGWGAAIVILYLVRPPAPTRPIPKIAAAPPSYVALLRPDRPVPKGKVALVLPAETAGSLGFPRLDLMLKDIQSINLLFIERDPDDPRISRSSVALANVELLNAFPQDEWYAGPSFWR